MIQQWVVGGACRDVLLGLVPKDIDFVWTGVTPDFLLNEKQFIQVGHDFPVFLDQNGCEHALARTETKNGEGYYGFAVDFNPQVTIAEDLYRRDLTCNSIAIRVEDWNQFVDTRDTTLVVDPWGGLQDIQNCVLRHTSEAFSEDVTRILRIARFSTRFNWSIAPETSNLIREMVVSGELEHLVPERVWSEMKKAIMEPHSARFFQELNRMSVLKVILPEVTDKIELIEPLLNRNAGLSLEQRFAVLFIYNQLDEVEAMLEDIKAPTRVRTVVIKIHNIFPMLNSWDGKNPTAALEMCNMLGLQHNTIISHLIVVMSIFCDKKLEELSKRLNTAYATARSTHFGMLSKIQQETLNGEEIGSALCHLKVIRINESLRHLPIPLTAS